MVDIRRLVLTVSGLLLSFILGLSLSLIDSRMNSSQLEVDQIVSFEDELNELQSMKLAFAPNEGSD